MGEMPKKLFDEIQRRIDLKVADPASVKQVGDSVFSVLLQHDNDRDLTLAHTMLLYTCVNEFLIELYDKIEKLKSDNEKLRRLI